MREVGNFGASVGTNKEASTSTNGFSNHISYSTNQSSTSNFMPSIAENESWNDSSFNSLKRSRDGDLKMFSNNFSGMTNQVAILVSVCLVFLLIFFLLLLYLLLINVRFVC